MTGLPRRVVAEPGQLGLPGAVWAEALAAHASMQRASLRLKCCVQSGRSLRRGAAAAAAVGQMHRPMPDLSSGQGGSTEISEADSASVTRGENKKLESRIGELFTLDAEPERHSRCNAWQVPCGVGRSGGRIESPGSRERPLKLSSDAVPTLSRTPIPIQFAWRLIFHRRHCSGVCSRLRYARVSGCGTAVALPRIVL